MIQHPAPIAKTIAFAYRCPLTACLWAMITLSALFLAFPALDITVSGWFHDSDPGFALAHNPLLRDIRELGLFTPKLIVITLVVVLLIKLAMPHVRSIIAPHITWFLLTSLIVGPGLIVNALLKSQWGRPRPRDTDLFGGDHPFMPPWVWSDYCERNCSFVSGEASSSFWTLALVFALPPDFRRPGFLLIAPYAVLISFNRILFGAHYLSDVLLAWTINFAVILMVYRLFVSDPPPAFAPHRLENALTRAGLSVRSWLAGPGRTAMRDRTQSNAGPRRS